VLQCVFQCVKTVAGYKDCDEYVCNYPVHALERYLHELSCVACSVLQCVAVCCSVLQCVAVCCSVLQDDAEYGAVCCSRASLLRTDACCSVLQYVAVCCSVL